MAAPQPEASNTALRLDGVQFAYGRNEAPVIDIDTLTLQAGEHVFLEGPSGSGKSTLLSLIAGILTPEEGAIHVLGHEMSALSPAGRDRVRADEIGIVFQLFNLLPYLSLLDNVLLPVRFSERRKRETGGSMRAARDAASQLLDRLGLGGLATAKRPVSALSVGQQQRVAAARALIGSPRLIIADEPTSALDADNQARFVETLLVEAARAEASVLFVSHDRRLTEHFDRILALPEINAALPVIPGAAA